MAPLITRLVNLSFSEGCFPPQFKLAQVSPLLKKAGLADSDPANYRQILNLDTIGKLTECLFCFWLGFCHTSLHLATSILCSWHTGNSIAQKQRF
jgi:hypothetical protein